jgi:hypothetical protein
MIQLHTLYSTHNLDIHPPLKPPLRSLPTPLALVAPSCKRLLSSDGQEGIVELNINSLPSIFLLTNMQIQRLTTLPHDIVKNHVQVVQHNSHFYHLNPELVVDVNKIVLFPVCTKDPMTKYQESIAAGNDYGRLGNLKSLDGTTRNACTPVRLYNINLQIRANHSTNHSIAFPITGPMGCSKVLPYVDANHRPQVTFLGCEMNGAK